MAGIANDDALLTRIVAAIGAVPGVAAVVLGGSRARGTAHAASDYDIGLYYWADRPIDTAALGQAVEGLDESDPPARVTAIGEWGANMDGGGWLHVGGHAVDLLYRELGRVEAAIEDGRRGGVRPLYQPGHPHAFLSTIPMGEIAICQPLLDRDGVVAGLQARTRPYPPALTQGICRLFLWEAEFAVANARKAVPRGDLVHVVGCGYRAVACLAQVLFALEGRYLINEKGAVAEAAGFRYSPRHWRERVEGAFVDLAAGRFEAGLAGLAGLHAETARLAGC
ncbi:nucleotidyltransferase-like protein [Stella humosa]|uniref:Nucleotidyltransferase-like protein n=1 Tax=Stella humosa TaxID=94 RepID=A0A3N1KR90_9PROT|nr:nucleotidyltransferase domain-containing protein [Stella humosa]ROP84373.1 nucleotidyltransferase-like protein [Stella humosa]BBK33889.1 hypothetical protein STHU_45230 [Stella humosa]